MHCASCGSETDASPCTGCGREALLRGRWRLEAMVGQGAHGTTWRAVDTTDGAVRAIKELPLRLGTPAKTVELFQREAAVLQQLDHPGIPACHDAFELGEGRGRALWIVLDFVDGLSLDRELRRHRYDEDEVLAVLEAILPTLAWLHGRSPPVVHRDLKPGNVIRTPDGRLVLVDFGSVRDALRDADLGGSTVAGTFGYMAPEQFAGDAGPRSDLYGLGALAVALLTRKPPHTLQDARGVLQWRAHARVSDGLAALLDRLLAAEVVDRPASAEAVLAEVRRLRAGEGSAPEPRPIERPGQAPSAPAVGVPAPGGPRALTVPAPQSTGARLSLAGSGRRVVTEPDHGALISTIEHVVGVSGRVEAVGDTLRWASDPTSGRAVRVTLEPTAGGTRILVAEDQRSLYGGLYGGLCGGLGGGLGGGTGWMIFEGGGPVAGFAYLAGILLFAFLLATGFIRQASRQRVVQLDDLVEALEGQLGGAVVARPDVYLPRSPGSAFVGAGAAAAAAATVALFATGVLGSFPLPLAGIFVFGFFGFFVIGGRGRSLREARERHARRVADRGQAPEAWDLEGLEEEGERVEPPAKRRSAGERRRDVS